jgi:hypothetical protein
LGNSRWYDVFPEDFRTKATWAINLSIKNGLLVSLFFMGDLFLVEN